MRIYDPLYGSFQVPPFLADLLTTPEVRRLSQVRLLNTVTPSLATLGELRRYSHTLGVLRLALANSFDGYTQTEWMAFLASVLLHDTGTPPFGHLMEYHLRELRGWHHEAIVSPLLWGGHHPANTAHQIFGSRVIEFGAHLDKSNIPSEIVAAIVKSAHPLSSLLFGTLDLDNLDNVVRMAWALGLSRDGDLALRIAASISIDKEGGLVMPADMVADVAAWLALRKKIYAILIFDPPTVAAQAVLSDALGQVLKKGILTETDWYLSDEGLLDRLCRLPETKAAIITEYLGRLPQLLFAVQIEGSLKDLAFPSRAAATDFIVGRLRKEFPADRPLGYVFVDHGSFSKRIAFADRESHAEHSLGVTSCSVILYGFLRAHRAISHRRVAALVRSLLEHLPITQDMVRAVQTAPDLERDDSQRKLRFAD